MKSSWFIPKIEPGSWKSGGWKSKRDESSAIRPRTCIKKVNRDHFDLMLTLRLCKVMCDIHGEGQCCAVPTPDTNVFPVSEGARSRHSTSAACPWKLCSIWPLSTSQRAHVPSPLDVRIYREHKTHGSRYNARHRLIISPFTDAYLHIWVCKAACRQVVCVHGHWFLLGGKVFVLVQG